MTTSRAVTQRLLFTPIEACELLAISRAKLYKLFAAGEIETVKIGGARRIPRQALEDYVESLRP